MLKAVAVTADGRKVLMIGLSFGNLDKFREEPGDTFVKLDGNLLGLDHDVVIFSAETEEKLVELLTAVSATAKPQ